MARASVENLAAALWRVVGEADLAQLGDAELLDRYVACDDERAFRAIVGRHAPLVWEVCARSLRGHQDAEDAFQATFIALARRVRAGERIVVLPAWLREVSWRAARDVRQSAARRREVSVESMSDVPGREPADPRELAAVLDEEVGRLPDDLRRPFELCRFEGQTYAEAARLLGCSVATVCRRVEQAATALRERLTRRGLVPSGTTAGGVLVSSTGAQAVPPGLAVRAADLALAVGAGKAVSPVLLATADAAVRSGGLGPFKLAALALVAAACGVGGLVLMTGSDRSAGPPSGEAPAPAPPREGAGRPLPPLAAARVVATPGGAAGGVTSVAFSADGRTLATLTPRHGTPFRAWDAATGALRAAVGLPDEWRAVTVQPVGPGFAALCAPASGPERVRWTNWDAARGTRVTPPVPSVAGVTAVAPDGRTAAIAFADRLVVLDPATGGDGERLPDAPGVVDALAFTADGNTLIAHGKGRSGEFVVWVREGGKWQRPKPGPGPRNFRTGRILAMSPDGRLVAAPCDNEFADPIVVHDLSRNGNVVGWFAAGGGPFALVFSPDSRAVAATNERAVVRVWEIVSGRLRRNLPGHGASVLSVAFSPDGRRLASGGADGTALVWDLGAPARPVPADDEGLLMALGGPDGAAAYDALLALAARPDDAVRLLRPLLLPAAPAAADAARWVQSLSSPEPVERRAAADAIERRGRSVEVALRHAMAASPPEEARLELLRLLDRLDGPQSPRRLAEARGLEALERAGTAAARALLADVAATYPDSLAGHDAAAAGRRLPPASPNPLTETTRSSDASNRP